MTTSDNAIGSKKEPRPIEELAKLDSYQDMTDEEINMVMQYRLEIAIKDSAYQAELESQRKTEQAKIESYRTLANHAKERLDELIAAPLQLGIITEEEA